MKQLFFTTALIGCIGLSSGAQDAKFSQYENAPLMVNPAATGKFDGQLRFGALGSHQRGEPSTLNHATSFADYKLTAKQGNYGIGVSYYQNWHQDFALTGNFFGVSAARHLSLDKANKHVLSLGVQASLAHGKLDTERPEFEEDLSGGGFDLKEGSVSGDRTYGDLAAGVLYTYNADNFMLESGFSFYHLTRPDNSIESISNRLGRRAAFSIHAAINLHPMTKMHLTSLMWREVLHWRTEHKVPEDIDVVYGILMESQNTRNTTILYGVATRDVSTFMVKGGLAFKSKLRLMASYERPFNDDVYNVRRGELSALFTL